MSGPRVRAPPSAAAKGVPLAPWALVMFFSIALVSRACGGCVRVASRAVCPTDATSLHSLAKRKPHFLPVAGMGAVRACPTLACMPPDFARAQKMSDPSARALVRPRGWPRAQSGGPTEISVTRMSCTVCAGHEFGPTSFTQRSAHACLPTRSIPPACFWPPHDMHGQL